MYDFDQDTDSTSTVFRDVILLALAGFIAIVILLLPHINPPKQDDSKDMPPPGNLMVQLFWDDKLDIDLDLWSQAPDDVAVGLLQHMKCHPYCWRYIPSGSVPRK